MDTTHLTLLHTRPQWIFLHKKIAISTIWGIILLTGSLFINYFAGTYASAHAGHAINDIIIDNLPTINVSIIFIYGIILFFVFIVALAIHRPQRAPFLLKSLSIFILIRSFFVILTHLGPIPQTINSIPAILDEFTFSGDLFFSAHTGLPFLMSLIFWPKKQLRYIFFSLSIIFGVAVLLGRLHYSIDVFSAFFITYGIFQIATKFFAKDYLLLKHTLNV